MHVYMRVSCLCTCAMYMVCVTSILELKDLLSPWCRSAWRVGLLCFFGSVPSSPTVLTARRTLGGSAGAIFHHVLPDIVSDGHFAVPLHPVRQCGIYLSLCLPSTHISDLSVLYVFSSVIVCLVQFCLAFMESLGSVRSGFSTVTAPSLCALRSTVSARLRGPAPNPSDICASSSTSLFLRA